MNPELKEQRDQNNDAFAALLVEADDDLPVLWHSYPAGVSVRDFGDFYGIPALVLGWDHNGEAWALSSLADGRDALWLLQTAIHRLMMAQENDDP